MAKRTRIEWTDATWNVITGCSVVSPGCTNCYAMRLAGTRLRHHPSRVGLTRDTKAGPVWTGEVRFNEAWLEQPLSWKRPRNIFVCAHGDLLHEKVQRKWLVAIYTVMRKAHWHKFQVLTKRAGAMLEFFSGVPALPHVWLGFSAEDQMRFNERAPNVESLADCGWLTWCSAEPLLGPIALGDAAGWLRWLVAGGESGPGARPMHPAWARSLRDQCVAAGVLFFFKQWGEWCPEAIAFRDAWPGRWHEWPETDDLAPVGAIRVGKSRAGRLLDGREWNEIPDMETANARN